MLLLRFDFYLIIKLCHYYFHYATYIFVLPLSIKKCEILPLVLLAESKIPIGSNSAEQLGGGVRDKIIMSPPSRPRAKGNFFMGAKHLTAQNIPLRGSDRPRIETFCSLDHYTIVSRCEITTIFTSIPKQNNFEQFSTGKYQFPPLFSRPQEHC